MNKKDLEDALKYDLVLEIVKPDLVQKASIPFHIDKIDFWEKKKDEVLN